MIERYSRPEMARIWDPEARIRRMLEVEVAFLKALSKSKRIPASQIRRLENLLSKPLAKLVKDKEEKSAHDVVALIEVVTEALKGWAPAVVQYLHFGLTSSDALDTAQALQLQDATDLLLQDWSHVEKLLNFLAAKHVDTWMAGRTHGVHAEPISFGFKLAGWHGEARRNIERLKSVRKIISFGKISGAVGTFAHFSPALESEVCRRLGLNPEPVSTQVVPRDRHAEYFNALALSACAIERFATEMRHLQRTEVLELEEPFGKGQKGSSAMPHKRNPVLCENLCGLARLIRGYSIPMMENVALWHERDISHSSVERVALVDATILLDFMLHRFAKVLSGLTVNARRMRENLDGSMGLVFSQRVLLALIDRGLERMRAYDIVQRNAMAVWKTRRHLKELLAQDSDATRLLSKRELAECFDLKPYRLSIHHVLKREGIRS